MNTPSHTASSYLPTLDGLRALSVLLVVCGHLGVGHNIPGGLGVTVFFFISGFIITRLLLQEWARYQTISLRDFYIRRFLRLAPALTVYLLFALGFALAIDRLPPLAEILASVFYAMNYYLMLVPPSGGEVYPSALQITWSLAVEEHYYLFYPLLLLGLAARPRALFWGLLSSLVVVLGWRIYLAYGVGLDALAPQRIYLGTDTRIDSIAYGALFAVVLRLRAEWPCLARAFAWADSPRYQVIGLLSAAGLVLFSLLVREETFRQSWRYSLQGVSIFILFMVLLGASNTTAQATTSKAALLAGLEKWLTHPVMLYIGKISYSLYLYHWLALCVVSWFFQSRYGMAHDGAMLVLSFAGAMWSYHWVEQPFTRLRQRYARVT
jgi:peptidoglycan/LPS O-acetylase OafA/YrhL